MNPKHELTLQNAPCGASVRVVRLDAAQADYQRLCEMGFCENACIKKIADGAALICSVCGVRVAVSAKLAERIFVQKVGHN
jgi:Fe2+ transport system protein FeoA